MRSIFSTAIILFSLFQMMQRESLLAQDLTSRIVDESGEPIKGALVSIYAAQPRIGRGVLCGSCYADCRKQSISDDDGMFEIADLDSQLVFQVLVAANGYRTALIYEVDPLIEMQDVKLVKTLENLPPTRRLKGKIVDNEGNPVFGALVRIGGALQKTRTLSGRVNNVDKASVTDQNGTFLLTSTEDYEAWRLEISASGFVELDTDLLETGDKLHHLVLDRGTSVTGTVTKNGEPVAGVAMGICQTDRGGDSFVGEYVIATDESGRFNFTSVLPEAGMTIYSKMEDGCPAVIELTEFTTSQSGDTKDLGEFKMGPAKKITGRITLPDGVPLPPSFRILVNRENAWDTQQILVGKNGEFSVDGLPNEEAVCITIRIAGYSLDHTRNNFHQVRSDCLAIYTDQSVDHLEIYMKADKTD
jgi:protocatechuate 3,4-dioxygenase beta subunit